LNKEKQRASESYFTNQFTSKTKLRVKMPLGSNSVDGFNLKDWFEKL
jgi:hypothetical protein